MVYDVVCRARVSPYPAQSAWYAAGQLSQQIKSPTSVQAPHTSSFPSSVSMALAVCNYAESTEPRKRRRDIQQ